MGRLLSIDEAAQRLRVSVCTLRYLRQEGRFAPATRIGRRLFWDEVDVEAWLQGQRERPVADRQTAREQATL